MPIQVCNSHGAPDGWFVKDYHNDAFNNILSQLESRYPNINAIALDGNKIEYLLEEDPGTFRKYYPDINLNNIDKLFLISPIDPVIFTDTLYSAFQNVMGISKDKIVDIIQEGNWCFAGTVCGDFYLPYKDLELPWTGDKLFLSYNRVARPHRVALIDALRRHDLLDHGLVSLMLADKEKKILIDEDPDHDTMAMLGNTDIWQQCLINIITESNTSGDWWDITEKTFKPIVGKRPFMFLGCRNGLKRLQSWGFKTFDMFWNELYDELPEDMAIEEICKILKIYSTTELKQIYDAMKPILDYNHQHFFGDFQRENKNRLDKIL